MKQLLTAVQHRLSSCVPQTLFCGEDKGQLNDSTLAATTAFPCILIDITSVQWNDESHGIQQGRAEVQIRMAYKPVIENGEGAFQPFDILADIHKALHGWSGGGEYYSKLTRTNTRRIERNDTICEYATTYTVQIRDTTAMAKPITTAINSVVVNGE